MKEEWLLEQDDEILGDLAAPDRVAPVPRLDGDLRVLERLTRVAEPPLRPVRPGQCAVAHYGFGDASGLGFGMAIWVPSIGIMADQGMWKKEVADKSSNFREALNMVRKLEELVATGELDSGIKLFLFTDNSTTDSVYYRGDA